MYSVSDVGAWVPGDACISPGFMLFGAFGVWVVTLHVSLVIGGRDGRRPTYVPVRRCPMVAGRRLAVTGVSEADAWSARR